MSTNSKSEMNQEPAAQLNGSRYTWRCATMNAAFEPRDGAGMLSFRGKLWLLGGWNPWCEEFFPHPQDTNSEVWSSHDGRHWEFETHAPWAGRHCAGWLVHDDGEGKGEKLFVVGGDANPPVGYDMDVWSSSNGKDWVCVNAQTPWSPRAGCITASCAGFLWLMGGQTKGDPDTTVGFAAGRGASAQAAASIPTLNVGAKAGSERAYNDVWRSRTGLQWECVTAAAPWAPRGWVGGNAVLNGRLWVVGGGFIGGFDPATGTVGYVQDSLVYPVPKPTRLYLNDVWSSADGREWICHTAHAAFRRRHYHEVLSWDSRLWVLGGFNGHPLVYEEEASAGAGAGAAGIPKVGSEGNRNDVWYSHDGVTWHELEGTPWAARHASSVTVHGDSLWISTGNTDWTGMPKLHGVPGMRADVWSLTGRA